MTDRTLRRLRERKRGDKTISRVAFTSVAGRARHRPRMLLFGLTIAFAHAVHAQVPVAPKDSSVVAQRGVEAAPAAIDEPQRSRTLPFLGEEARKRGIELPDPFGVGLVYYYLNRDIRITDVRVGRNGAPPASAGDFVNLGSNSKVNNVNVKADVWILPFLNLYAIAGVIDNKSTTHIDVTLPPLLPNGNARRIQVSVPTKLSGSVGGLGATLAGGYRSFFVAADVNVARADLGFDDRFRATVSSMRAGWNGQANGRPLRIWANATYWDTFAIAKGTADDPNGGTLAFEVDQGPAHPWTYGGGFSYAPRRWFEFSTDVGFDGHGGWYVAIVPVLRF